MTRPMESCGFPEGQLTVSRSLELVQETDL